MRKIMIILGLVISISLLLVACGTEDKPGGDSATPVPPPSTSDTPSTPDAPVVPTPAEQKKQPADINLVTPDATITPEYVEALNKRFPDYTITHINHTSKGNSLAELIATKTPIDIIGRAATAYGSDILNHDLQYDMTDMIKKYNIDLNEFEPQLVNFVKGISNGGIYGIPGGSAINHVLFYNKTIFDKFGIDYPVDGMTWDEAFQVADRLTRKDGDKQYYGFTGHIGIMLSANQLGLSFVDPDTNKTNVLNDERWKGWVEKLFTNPTLNDAYRSTGRAFSGGAAQLVGGDVAMLLFNASIAIVNKSLQEQEIDWDMVALPTFKEAPKVGSTMNSTLWGLTSITRDRDAAMDVIQYLVLDENLMEFSKIGYLVPKVNNEIIKSFASEATPKDKNWNAVIYNDYAPFAALTPYNSLVTAPFTKYIEQIVKGEVDVNTALRLIDEEAQLAINEKLSQQ